MPVSDPDSPTGGAPFLITQVEEIGERDRRIHYLLEDGRRWAVLLDVALDNPTLRERIGRALLENKRSYGH